MSKAKRIWTVMLVLVMSLMGIAVPSAAQVATPPRAAAPSPNEIVATAKADEWVTIAPSDLLVMDLAPDAKAKPRRVVIQLMPAPFSQGWISNIRKLATAHWWDGLSVNRVQDNYVAQWGDVTEKKALPEGLVSVGEAQYESLLSEVPIQFPKVKLPAEAFRFRIASAYKTWADPYAIGLFAAGWATASNGSKVWPTHCYAMVGVGRNLSPDTGTGAELYTVIGHAPRHLDRNIALVGRVIEGIEHLSSLPRGTGALGFYTTAEERVPILSVRLATDLPSDKPLPRFQYLSTESTSFAAYADARANRRDPFFIVPAGGADICNIPVPIRRAP
jgi:cyclophilin family peptidyl-prolyl cis-trans isomerase